MSIWFFKLFHFFLLNFIPNFIHVHTYIYAHTHTHTLGMLKSFQYNQEINVFFFFFLEWLKKLKKLCANWTSEWICEIAFIFYGFWLNQELFSTLNKNVYKISKFSVQFLVSVWRKYHFNPLRPELLSLDLPFEYNLCTGTVWSKIEVQPVYWCNGIKGLNTLIFTRLTCKEQESWKHTKR